MSYRSHFTGNSTVAPHVLPYLLQILWMTALQCVALPTRFSWLHLAVYSVIGYHHMWVLLAMKSPTDWLLRQMKTATIQKYPAIFTMLICQTIAKFSYSTVINNIKQQGHFLHIPMAVVYLTAFRVHCHDGVHCYNATPSCEIITWEYYEQQFEKIMLRKLAKML